MASAETIRSADEVERLGTEIFARRVVSVLQPQDDGKFVAIDVSTGDFEIEGDDYVAIVRLRSRKPDADIWMERVGQPAAYHVRGRQ